MARFPIPDRPKDIRAVQHVRKWRVVHWTGWCLGISPPSRDNDTLISAMGENDTDMT